MRRNEIRHDVAIVAFVRKRAPEIQYLLASITEEQRQEFGQLVEATARQIETAQFPSHRCICQQAKGEGFSPKIRFHKLIAISSRIGFVGEALATGFA